MPEDPKSSQSSTNSRFNHSKLVEFYRETNTNEVIKKSDMFKGMEFYIVNVDE